MATDRDEAVYFMANLMTAMEFYTDCFNAEHEEVAIKPVLAWYAVCEEMNIYPHLTDGEQAVYVIIQRLVDRSNSNMSSGIAMAVCDYMATVPR